MWQRTGGTKPALSASRDPLKGLNDPQANRTMLMIVAGYEKLTTHATARAEHCVRTTERFTPPATRATSPSPSGRLSSERLPLHPLPQRAADDTAQFLGDVALIGSSHPALHRSDPGTARLRAYRCVHP